MKKKKLNRFLALTLAAAMALGQPASAYAAEPAKAVECAESTEEAVTEEESEALPTGDNETAETVEEPENEENVPGGEESTRETVSEEATEESTAAETETEKESEEIEETAETAETVEETTETAEETVEETKESVETAAAVETKEYGFTGMTLSSVRIEEKQELEPVVTALASMKAEEDYLEGQIVFFAETQEEANQIAECYAGTLVEYEEGVAVAEISAAVKDAVSAAADMNSSLPAVYPNIIYQINDGWETTVSAAEAEETAGETEADLVEREEEETEAETAERSGEELPYEDEHLYAAAPNDAYFGRQWHHETMNTVEAWNATKGNGVTVAVIDTGIDYMHPDLKGNVAGHYSTCDSSDGRDDNGHGTHCAGIIAAAANNGIGVSGMAPEAKIYAVKVLDKFGSGRTSNIVQGVLHATQKETDVISMSLGGICWDGAFQKAIDKAVSKGIVVVAAAGNDSVSQKSYPAAYNNVIAVAATDSYDRFTFFSNYGNWVDIAAPGLNILSTLPTNLRLADVAYVGTGTSYGYMSGTSMACPVVAGTVALMLGNCDETLRNRNDSTEVITITKTLINSSDPYGAYNYYEKNPNCWYPLADAESCTYAVDDSEVAMPEIYFSQTPSNKNVVLAGSEQYFELKTSTEHAKIYYTINGAKPTVKNGWLYQGKVYIPRSGKVKIQAVAVVGTKTSKVFSKTYTFDVRPEALSTSCKDEMTVAVGKSIQLSVIIAPSNTSNQKLVWTSDDATGKIKVNKKTGKVSCKKGTEEGFSATITATTEAKTTDGKQLEYKFKVTAVKGSAEGLTLNATNLKMSYWADKNNVNMIDSGGQAYVQSYKLVPSVEGGVETDQYLYKSSNTKVAVVKADGTISAIGKGTANITVTANDGSGKKAVCKVTVVTPVFHISAVTSTGFTQNASQIPIATGCSIQVATTVNYGSSLYHYVPNDKKLVWTSDNPNVTVKNGKVTCGKNVRPGTKVQITASAKDGFGASVTLNFVVTDKIKKIVYVDSRGRKASSVNAKLQVGYFMYDLLSGGRLAVITENNSNNFYGYCAVETSNRDVVYRTYDSQHGMVIVGTKPGTSKVTYKALDGSNAKFTINLKITE